MLQLLQCTALQIAHSNAYQVLRQVQHSHRSQQGFPLGVEGPMQHAISQATSCRPPCNFFGVAGSWRCTWLQAAFTK